MTTFVLLTWVSRALKVTNPRVNEVFQFHIQQVITENLIDHMRLRNH